MISGFLVYRWFKLSKWVRLPPACYSSELAVIFRGFASSLQLMWLSHWHPLLISVLQPACSSHVNASSAWWAKLSFLLVKHRPKRASWNHSIAFCLNTTWPQALISASPSNPPGQEYQDWGEEVTSWRDQSFTLVATHQGASLIYKDAVIFIKACLIKSLFHFHLILAFANFSRSVGDVLCRFT